MSQLNRKKQDVPFAGRLNTTLQKLPVYASKAISLRAKKDPSIANLSFGEPEFGPPEHTLAGIEKEDLTMAAFLDAAKRYEEPRGSLALRSAIADWYHNRYGITVDPETEVMVTHGGVEALTLAMLCTSEVGDEVAISDPSYMLYERTIASLGRRCRPVTRRAGTDEYLGVFGDEAEARAKLGDARSMIINSPENPSGYVLSAPEWEAVAEHSQRTGLWVIHDEVYDVMAFSRPHLPARGNQRLAERAIMVNSFSKKFGLPGLRIGWLVASAPVIDLASKLHDYLYLGVNIQYERIATRLLGDARNQAWFEQIATRIANRARSAVASLGEEQGFSWPRRPLGAMFLFPNVRGVWEKMPAAARAAGGPVGDAVARYLIEERGVAVVPGSVYGSEGDEYVRMVLCTTDEVWERALARLRGAA